MLEWAIGTRGAVLGSRSWLRRALLCLKGGGLLLKIHRYSPKRDRQNWHGRLFHIPVRSGCVNHIGQTARKCGTGHSHGRGTVFGGPWPWALRKKRHENEREHVRYQPPGRRSRDIRHHHHEPHGRWLGVCGGNYFRALGRVGGLLPLAALLRSTRAGLATKSFGAPA